MSKEFVLAYGGEEIESKVAEFRASLINFGVDAKDEELAARAVVAVEEELKIVPQEASGMIMAFFSTCKNNPGQVDMLASIFQDHVKDNVRKAKMQSTNQFTSSPANNGDD
jgi:hypothetical protein